MIELAKRQNIGLKKQLNELDKAEKALIVQNSASGFSRVSILWGIFYFP